MPIHVLVIEDEAQIRKNLQEMLVMRGYEVTAAANGQGGIAEAILQPPDVILCDIMMPKLDGYKVLESIRTNPTLAHVPFIFLTAKADMADLRRGMTLGADDYLAKPFGMKELVAAIESRLKRQQQNQKAPPPTLFMKTIHGHDERGHMVLQTEDCLYFFIRNKKNFVRHLLGTFQIHVPFEKLAIELDPNLFFRANRNSIIHRKTVQKYAYWENGKYCLFLQIDGQNQEAILPRARYNSFKKWLAE
ncbi:response regulator [Larkinella sp.]|uniref:response regulator n=1 Tax=Larkinella sp. TaxID=2034517 RepID=UPI003BACD4EB